MSKAIEQLQAENEKLKKELSYQKARFSALSSFERNAKEIFLQMDFSLKTTYVSSAIEDFLGYTPQEYLEKDLQQVMTPASYKKVIELSRQVIEKEQIINHADIPEFYLWDIEFISKEGEIKKAKIKFHLFFDENKETPKGVQGLIFHEGMVNLVSRETEQMKGFFNSFFSQSIEGVFLFLLPDPLPWNKKVNRDIQLTTILNNLKPVGFNDVILEQFKMTMEEFSMFRLTHIHDINSTLDFWEKLFDDVKMPIRQLMRNHLGEPIAIEGEFVTLYNDKKEILGVFGIQHDITDSFLLEKTTENELKLKKLWDKANFSIFVVQNEDIVFWNHTAFDIIKPHIDKNKRYKISDIVYEEDLPLVVKRYRKRVQGENVESTYDIRIITSTGEIRWLQLHSAFYIWNGKPATLNFARDITEEVRLRKELEITNHRFQILSQNSSDAIAIYKGINLVYFSINIERLLGYIPKVNVVFDLLEYIHPEDRERVKQEMEDIIKNQKTHETLVYRIQHASGKYLWWEVSVDIKYKDGQLDENIAVARDITRRKELEEEIKQKEALYRLLAENTSDGVSLYEYGKLVYQSPGRKKMLGQMSDIKTLDDAFKHIHPEDVTRVREIMAKVIKEKLSSVMIQYRAKHYEGYYVWIEVLSNVEYDKDGNPYRVIFKTRNITSRKTLEEKIRQSEAQYRLLAENSTDGVALFEHGELIYISPSYSKILGDYLDVSRIEEMFDYIHPEDLPRIKKLVERILVEKIERDISLYRIRKSDGTYAWFEDIILSEFDENGNQIRVIINSRDVTKRVEAQQKLAEKEKQIKLLLENMSDFLFLIDKDGIIKFTTPYTLTYFGYEEIEVIGKSFFEFIYSHDLERLIQDFSEAVRDKKIEQKIYRVVKKNGHLFWMEITGNAIENNNLEFVIVGRDISERIEIQEQLKRQHKELLELNATKDKFFSILAHDLRSPFNQIMGFSDLLKKNVNQYDTDKIAHFVGIIRNSSVKAFQLLENLLNWSMAKRGMMEFHPVTVNIISVVKEETNRLLEQIQTKNIDIQVEDSPDLFLIVDENMFRIIIRNLINNAIKFTPINGEIIIGFEDNESDIMIFIKDNGIGIEQIRIRSIFELSENRSTDGTKGEKGTGLGLLVVKEFVDKHNAKIEIKSQKNKGTEVQLTFPKDDTVIMA